MSTTSDRETPEGSPLVVIRAWGDMKPSERIRRVTNMYLDGIPHAEIGEAVGMTAVEVGLCLVDVKKLWISQGLMDFNEAKCRELARIDRMEFAAWESFELSRRPLIISRRRKQVEPDPCSESSEATQLEMRGPGDPKWMAIIAKAIEMRAKILGLMKDQKVINNTYMQVDWDSLVRTPGKVETLQDVRDIVEDDIARMEAEADEYERNKPLKIVKSNSPPQPATTPKPAPPSSQKPPLRKPPAPIVSSPHLPLRPRAQHTIGKPISPNPTPNSNQPKK